MHCSPNIIASHLLNLPIKRLGDVIHDFISTTRHFSQTPIPFARFEIQLRKAFYLHHHVHCLSIPFFLLLLRCLYSSNPHYVCFCLCLFVTSPHIHSQRPLHCVAHKGEEFLRTANVYFAFAPHNGTGGAAGQLSWVGVGGGNFIGCQLGLLSLKV